LLLLLLLLLLFQYLINNATKMIRRDHWVASVVFLVSTMLHPLRLCYLPKQINKQVNKNPERRGKITRA